MQLSGWVGSCDARDHTQHIMHVNAIARLEMPRNRFRADSGEADLPIGIVGIYEIDVERDLSVDTDRLNFLDEAGATAFQHSRSLLEARECVSGSASDLRLCRRQHRGFGSRFSTGISVELGT